MRAQGLVVKVHNKVPIMKSEGHLGNRRDASPIGVQAAKPRLLAFLRLMLLNI